VEDDPINQIVATRFIEAEGYIARVVDNGFQALELLEKHRNEFALVLMDYFMPVMDGCEVTRRYRSSEESEEKGSHLPIVGLTASILAVDHQRCRQAGMDDVLLKPIGREALRAALIKYVAA
jgi:two-component system sensor histidine kinase EvgS